MIPKVIHLCWFSGENPNRFIRNCIKTWKNVMPDYQIRLWDANSFDFQSVPFVKAAWEAKKWAFVSDYIRIYALYTEGGVYLDSDVKTFRRFDDFLDNRFFIGSEPMPGGKVELESAIMGAEPGHPYLKECLDFYKTMQFVNDKQFMEDNVCPKVMSRLMEGYGYKYVNCDQNLAEGIKVYDDTYFGHFCGTAPGDYYAIHYYNNSWVSGVKHGWLYNFCKENDLMPFYIKIEKFVSRVRGTR